jgi:hypothetical protein
MKPGWSIDTVPKQPPTPTIQPRSVVTRRHPAQLEFVDRELARFVQARTREPCTYNDYVSILFLVLKPGNNQWRLICDMRTLNKHCVRKRLKMETPLGVKHLMRKGDYMFSFDLQDGFYALGINPTDCDHFIDFRGHLYRLTGLAMGWSLSLFYFFKMTLTFVNFAHRTRNSLSHREATARRPTSKQRVGMAR